jgi:mono/diheme cytochrome c family protein
MSGPRGFRLAALVLAPALAILVLSNAGRTRADGASLLTGGGDAKSTFDLKCAKCHGRDGRGKTMRGRATHARDLTVAQWQNDVTDERLFNSISNGRGKKMPGFKKNLSEAEIDALVAYVRRLKR